MNNQKMCECGCGLPSGVYLRTHGNCRKGEPKRFIAGHSGRPKKPGKYYPMLSGNKYAHRVAAENALGRPLPKGAEVHHVDGTKRITSQLVICQDFQYHMLLHRRTRIVRAGGNPNTQKICSNCKQVKDLTDFYLSPKTPSGYYQDCKPCKRDKERLRKLASVSKVSIESTHAAA